MSQLLIGPLLLVAMCLVWFAVQRAWIACMGEPAGKDGLERPGYCGGACSCRADCPRRRQAGDTESIKEEWES